MTITGGSIGGGFTSVAGSSVDISGGSFGDRFQAQDGSNISISGGDFSINGVKIPGLDVSGASLPMNIPAGAVLSGVLSDGTPFAFSSTDGDEITDGTLTLKTTTLPPVAKIDLTVPGDVVGSGIRGQHLTVLSGGSIGDNFNVGPNSTITLDAGGTIGRNLEAVGSVVNIRGGTVGDSLDAFAGTVVNITGGTIGESILGAHMDAHPGSIVNISGGTFFAGLRGYTVRAFDDSVINLHGTEFLLDGVPVAGLVPGVPFELLARTGFLTGNLKDGSQLNIALRGAGGLPSQLISPNATLNLIVVPEPTGVILLGVAVAGLIVRRAR